MGIDPDEADRLLDGVSQDPANAALAELLRSAAGPALPRELAGEDRALAGFRHRGYPTKATKPTERRKRRVGVLAGAVVAALLAGGTAAAGTGRLPDPLQRAAHDWLSAVGVPDSAPTPSPTRAPASVRPSRTPSHPPSPAPSASTVALADLCRRWREDKNHKLPGPQQRELAAAAGGEDRIAGYCAVPSGSAPPASSPAPPGPSKDKPHKPEDSAKPPK